MKDLALRKYILIRHHLVLDRNTTFEQVSCKVNEYFVSENRLDICFDGFNKDRISICDNRQEGRQFSTVIKTRFF